MGTQQDDGHQTDSMTRDEQLACISSLGRQLLKALGDHGNGLSSSAIAHALPNGVLQAMRRIDNDSRGEGATNYGSLLARDAIQRSVLGHAGVRFATELFGTHSALQALQKMDLSSDPMTVLEDNVGLLIATLRSGILTLKGFVYEEAGLDSPDEYFSKLTWTFLNQPDLFEMLGKVLQEGVKLIKSLPKGYQTPICYAQLAGDHPANNITVDDLLRALQAKIEAAHKNAEAMAKLR